MNRAAFFTILGKTLALAVVGAEAYAQANAGGVPSLLEPQNLFNLISEVEGVLKPAAPAAVAPQVATVAPAPSLPSPASGIFGSTGSMILPSAS